MRCSSPAAPCDTVKLVKELSCASCDVKIYDLNENGMDKAEEYGVSSVPTVVVNGKILNCCSQRETISGRAQGCGHRNAKVKGWVAHGRPFLFHP